MKSDRLSGINSTGPLFHDVWKRRIAENLMVGVASEDIVKELVLSGFEEEFAAQAVAEYESNPGIEAGRVLVQRQRKQSMFFEVMAETARQSRYSQQVVKKVLRPEEFYEQYFWRNWPVVLQDCMSDWPALEKWTAEYFAEHYGNEIVEITSERESDPLFEYNLDQHRSRIRMRDYVRRIRQCADATNDFYLVAKNGLLANKAFHDLFDDIRYPAGLLDPAKADSRNVSVWFGPAGTITPLHHDGSNILLAQVKGCKVIKLISPFFMGYLYNTRACFSEVDLERIDYERFPLMRHVEILTLTLEPGELLFIPIGWWHWVKSLDVSISISFQNFVFPGKAIRLKLNDATA